DVTSASVESEWMSTPTEATEHEHVVREAPGLAKLAGMTLGLGAILVVLLALFILPSLRSGPHDLPIGVVNGSPSISSVLTDVAGDGYAVQEFGSRADLLAAISDREVVGGLVVEDTGIEVAVASAGSTAISGALSQTGTAVARAVNLPPTITDVVPLPEDDPTGIGLGGLTFPLVFGGIVPVVA